MALNIGEMSDMQGVIRNLFFAGACFYLLLPAESCAIGNAIEGKKKAELCLECHLIEGGTPDQLIPMINGQMQEYIISQLEDYKMGRRSDAVMNKVIQKSNLKISDIIDISAFYSSLPVMQGTKKGTALSAKGRSAFIGRRCTFCHNDWKKDAVTFIGGAPIISGQNKDYLFKSLKDIQLERRKADVYGLMNRILQKIPDSEIEAISEFLSTL